MVLKDFQENKAVEHILYSWPVITVAALLTILSFWGVYNSIKAELAIKTDINNFEKKINDEKMARENFAQKLASLQDQTSLDKEARGKFNLKKPGEDVVLFLNDVSVGMQKNSGEGALKSILGFLKKQLGF